MYSLFVLRTLFVTSNTAPIGQMPPNLAKVVLNLAILDRSVAVCGELGVPDQLRKIIVKE